MEQAVTPLQPPASARFPAPVSHGRHTHPAPPPPSGGPRPPAVLGHPPLPAWAPQADKDHVRPGGRIWSHHRASVWKYPSWVPQRRRSRYRFQVFPACSATPGLAPSRNRRSPLRASLHQGGRRSRSLAPAPSGGTQNFAAWTTPIPSGRTKPAPLRISPIRPPSDGPSLQFPGWGYHIGKARPPPPVPPRRPPPLPG